MQHDKAGSGPILRLFEAKAKQGRGDELAQKFATTSVEVVRSEPGNQGYFFGQTIEADADVLLFASVWESLDAIQERFGADWQSSFLPEGYADLIEECSVRHFALGAMSVESLPGQSLSPR